MLFVVGIIIIGWLVLSIINAGLTIHEQNQNKELLKEHRAKYGYMNPNKRY